MVKTKQQKPRHKKQQPQIKKQGGKQVDSAKFRAQLDALGLKIIQVTADGNCFFRALADQLEGNEEEHGKYRSMVAQYIMKNRETFEPFIEDDVPFDEYCKSMDKDGTWAGHMELQAASLVTRSNICIHRNMSPRWYIRNFNHRGVHMIHLSYHDEEHYNSVRLKDDPCDGPARPIIIKADADVSATSDRAKDAVNKSKRGTSKDVFSSASIKMVMAGSGCETAEKVEQEIKVNYTCSRWLPKHQNNTHDLHPDEEKVEAPVLLQVHGDVDAAIEFLIAEQGTEECTVDNDSLHCPTDISGGDDEDGNSEHCNKEPTGSSGKDRPSNNAAKQSHNESPLQDDKKIPRNKVCPCGSKKKYKACCGSAAGKTSAKQSERIGRTGSHARKQNLVDLVTLTERHLIWVHFVFDFNLDVSFAKRIDAET